MEFGTLKPPPPFLDTPLHWTEDAINKQQLREITI